MKIGFIGTGHITTAIVEGLCSGSEPPASIIVSPRNAQRAAAVAAAHAQVRIGTDNQAVVDGSDIVVLAVRPQDFAGVVGALRFASRHNVISLIAMQDFATVQATVRPARTVSLAVPMPPAALKVGPIACFPREETALALWSKVGTPVVAATEHEFLVLWSLTSLIAPYFAQLDEVRSWCARHGVDPERAARYLAEMFRGLSAYALRAQNIDFATLSQAACTPGGLNEQTRREIGAAGGFAHMPRALDGILARLLPK